MAQSLTLTLPDAEAGHRAVRPGRSRGAFTNRAGPTRKTKCAEALDGDPEDQLSYCSPKVLTSLKPGDLSPGSMRQCRQHISDPKDRCRRRRLRSGGLSKGQGAE
jgi:hypothetical protein